VKYIALGLFTAVAAWGAATDGNWIAKVENRKGVQEIVLHLKADGDRLTGTVAMGKRMRAVTIEDGKITGNEISFTTTAKGRKQKKAGKLYWTARLSENTLQVSSRRDGKGKGRSFTAVRQ